MYVGVGALNEVEQASFMQLIPTCYTQEFDDCWHEKDTKYPNCQTVNQLWSQDKPWTEQVVDAMPYCSSVKARDEKIIWAASAGLFGLVLGILAAGSRE